MVYGSSLDYGEALSYKRIKKYIISEHLTIYYIYN